jgi:hypothetical protein
MRRTKAIVADHPELYTVLGDFGVVANPKHGR